jgi:Rps23 Pro-64 3,4-dihydroxylase Tpa1-like proline 4-hydroxylase
MSKKTKEQIVDVEVVLTGGLRFASRLPATSPVLRNLYVALGQREVPEHQRQGFLLQLPVDAGKTACSFMSTDLIFLQTRPPVLVEPQSAQAPVLPQSRTAPAAPPRPNHVVIDDFLTPAENWQLLGYALESQAQFEGSKVIGTLEDYRKSQVLYAIKHSRWRDVFLNRLKLHLPHIQASLGASSFSVGEFEIQLTASGDGDYFKAHADHSPETRNTAAREITYVYYFHREPKSFAGGALLIYHDRPEQLAYESLRSVTAVAPRNNCLVLFASACWHELDVVRCPSGQFADSRFTVNGWLHPQGR